MSIQARHPRMTEKLNAPAVEIPKSCCSSNTVLVKHGNCECARQGATTGRWIVALLFGLRPFPNVTHCEVLTAFHGHLQITGCSPYKHQLV